LSSSLTAADSVPVDDLIDAYARHLVQVFLGMQYREDMLAVLEREHVLRRGEVLAKLRLRYRALGLEGVRGSAPSKPGRAVSGHCGGYEGVWWGR
jgi:hypothetical protein